MLSMLELFLPLFAVVLVVGPVVYLMSKGVNQQNAKRRVITQISMFVGIFILTFMFGVYKAYAQTEVSGNPLNGTLAQGLGFLAAAIATSCSSIGAGIAVSSAASAAIGAISENSENFGKAMIFVALGEGVAIYGILISILIINKL